MSRSSTSPFPRTASQSLSPTSGGLCFHPGKMTADPNGVSATEQSTAAQIGAILFRHRGWLPLLFLGIPLVLPGSTSPFRWEVGLALIVVGEAVRLAGGAPTGPGPPPPPRPPNRPPASAA